MALAVGPSIEDGLWLSTYVYTLPTRDPDVEEEKGGTTSKNYSASPVIKAKLEKKTPRKIGAVVDTYEPEIIALLMGEV